LWLNILFIAVIDFIVNVPCGFWREGTRRFSPAWFLAIHLPIPLVVILRKVTGIGYVWYTFPIFFAAYMGGQFLGSRIRRRKTIGAQKNHEL
jgi:hypothetical protein